VIWQDLIIDSMVNVQGVVLVLARLYQSGVVMKALRSITSFMHRVSSFTILREVSSLGRRGLGAAAL
jgi:hypothetical protein